MKMNTQRILKNIEKRMNQIKQIKKFAVVFLKSDEVDEWIKNNTGKYEKVRIFIDELPNESDTDYSYVERWNNNCSE